MAVFLVFVTRKVTGFEMLLKTIDNKLNKVFSTISDKQITHKKAFPFLQLSSNAWFD